MGEGKIQPAGDAGPWGLRSTRRQAQSLCALGFKGSASSQHRWFLRNDSAFALPSTEMPRGVRLDIDSMPWLFRSTIDNPNPTDARTHAHRLPKPATHMLLRRLLPSATAATASSFRRPLQQQRVRTLAAASQGGGGGGADVDPAQHCLDLVKTHDYEAYLCGLLVPTTAR